MEGGHSTITYPPLNINFLEVVASLGLAVSLSQSVRESRFSKIGKREVLADLQTYVGHVGCCVIIFHFLYVMLVIGIARNR